MTGITEGYLTRHYQGIRGARDAAVLDIAQDHALYHLHRVGLDPEQVHARKADDFRSEDIGYLTGKVDIPGWMTTVTRRFGFLRDLDDQEQLWCACNPRDDHDVTQALATITDRPPPPEPAWVWWRHDLAKERMSCLHNGSTTRRPGAGR